MKKVFFTLIFLPFIFVSNVIAQDDIAKLAQAFGNLPEISNVRISPDGSKLLMMQNYQGRKILVTRSLEDPDQQPNGIPPVGNQEYKWAMWASNDRILASVRFPYTENFMKVLTIDTYETRLISMKWDGSDPVNPIGNVPDRIRQPQYQDLIVDVMLDDPDHVLMELDWRERFEYGVFKIDITKTRNPKFVARENRYVFNWRSDTNHEVRYGDGYNERWGSRSTRYVAYHRKSLDDRWETLVDIDRREELPPFMFQGFSKDPSIIYITARDETGHTAAYTYNVDTRQKVEKIASVEGYDIERVYVNEHDELEYYTWYDIQPRIAYFDETEQSLLELFKKTFPGTSINFHSETKDKNIIVFETTSPTEPGTFYIFNRKERKMEMLGYNYAAVNVENLSEMKPVSYKARDGLEIPGYLTLPKGKEGKNLPTVILPHGGPDSRDNWQFDYWVQFLASQGYAVFQMNFRGSTGYGDEYEELGAHQWGDKIISDIIDGTKWVVEQGYADPNRTCIAGEGYGGYAALQSPIVEQSLYKCAIAFAPYTNLDRLTHEMFGYGIEYIKSDNYDLTDVSPSKNADNMNVPVLLLHGALDINVEVEHSQYFYEYMTRRNKDIKYIEWEDGDHFLSKQKHRVEFLEEMGRFLKEHLS